MFIIYGIINDVLNGKADSIDIQGYDIYKCFDELGYEESHNDLWDVGLKDDKFAMIAKLDENAQVVVKTPVGVTEEFELTRKVMQGTVFAPIKCSVQIDSLGRDCLNTGEGLYEYKGMVEVPALSMVDDILGITACSDASVELNSIINGKIEAKNLRLSNKKCYKIHISKKPEKCSIKLKAHDGIIKEVRSASYLGDIINEDGSIDDTIKSRGDKSIGKTNQVLSILSSVSLGMFYMDIALTLRESMFLSGILTNSETWYNVKEEYFKVLENADNELMRKIFNSHSKTACELFWLETGKIPIRYIIAKRRFMYLWQIVRQNEEQLLKKGYNAQKLRPTKGDWFKMIQEEKIKFGIDETDDQISKLSKNKFKRIIEKKVNSFAFKTLKVRASSHSKSLKILSSIENQTVVKRQEYLRENRLTKDDCQLLFKLRTKMLDVKSNFSNLYENDVVCRTCNKLDSIEDEDHLLTCESLKSENHNPDVKFNFVYLDLNKQVQAVKTYKAILRKREVLLKYL